MVDPGGLVDEIPWTLEVRYTWTHSADTQGGVVIFVVIRMDIRPEKREDFLAGITRYSARVREEPGNLVFSCFASVEQPDEYAVIANYADQAAGQAHVASEHAQWFFGWLPSVVASVPKIVYQELPDAGWSEMQEVVME